MLCAGIGIGVSFLSHLSLASSQLNSTLKGEEHIHQFLFLLFSVCDSTFSWCEMEMEMKIYLCFGCRLMGKVASDKCHKWVFKEPTECEPNISNYWQSSFDAVCVLIEI